MAKLPPPRTDTGDYTNFTERTAAIWVEGASGELLSTSTSNELEWVTISAAAGSGLVVNESGDAAADFRVESDSEANMIFVDSSGDETFIGGSTNGTKIAKGEAPRLIGTATVWEDLRVEPSVRGTGSNNPAFEKWFDDATNSSVGVFLYGFTDVAAANEKEVYFTMQMPHQWAQTDIHMHVHWVGNKDDTTSTPRWGLEYAWVKPNAVYGDTTIIYAVGNIGDDADTTAYKHYITEFADIAPGTTANGLSAILIGRLFRNSSDALDTYNVADNKCGLLYIDAHYEVDSLGSTQEYTK